MVVQLFINRMGTMLPDQWKTPKLWNQIKLPRILGGLGLGLGRSIYDILNNCPYPTRRVAIKLWYGLDVREELILLNRLISNPAMRGSVPYKEKAHSIEESLIRGEYPLGSGHKVLGLRDLWDQFPESWDVKDLLHRARNENILSFEEFSRQQSRGVLFADLLLEKPGRKNTFNTTPFKERYSQIWEELMFLTEGFDPPIGGINEEEFPDLERKLRNASFSGFISYPKTTSTIFGRSVGAIGVEGPSLLVGAPKRR
jgi:hypothetical protein